MTTPVRDPWGDHFDENEQTLLTPFVTNLSQPVFGLRNLPEVVKGALFSRYSRTDKSLRRILLDEFIHAPESGFAAIVGSARETGTEQLVATQQAEAFYERVLIGYGDDSVAELGGAHLACEGISNIAAKALEDSRIGISPLEKSTRYVVFNRKQDGQYRYLREPAIMASRHASRYESTLDHLFDTYSTLLEPTITFVRERTPRDEQTSQRAYNSATRAKACDILRGLLPMATLTNVGLFGNGRAFEYLLTKLYASPLEELQTLAGSMQHALDVLIPSFVKRAKNERGRAYQQYLRDARERVADLVKTHTLQDIPFEETPESMVHLVEYDQQAEAQVIAAILYSHLELPLATAQEIVGQLPVEERLTFLRAYVGERQNRFHRPGRAFEEASYTFDVLADLGAYRDMQRHRMLTQERQRYTIHHGFITPTELVEAGLDERYNAALQQAAESFDIISTDLPEAAQYIVPMAFRIRWRMTLNLRELYHLCELRSAPQGHPTYRAIAQSMYAQVRNVHPTLAEGMRFVDMNEYTLERIDAERRLDAKLSQKMV
ncbi:MAG: FAD-dependent thymidylate synthase [Chloroflexota bacterium]